MAILAPDCSCGSVFSAEIRIWDRILWKKKTNCHQSELSLNLCVRYLSLSWIRGSTQGRYSVAVASSAWW